MNPSASAALDASSQPSSATEGALKALLDQLRESEERFRTMADCAPVMLWMAGTDALCSFFNKGWLDFSGRPLDKEIGNGWAEGVHAEDFQGCMTTYMSSFVARAPFRMEYRLRRHDGEYRWILDTGLPRFEPGGAFAGYIGSCIDITEMREAHAALQRLNTDLESRVAERTAELTRSNEDLEQFSYAVSHDLQAPLRTISSFIGLLEKRYADRLDKEGRELLGFVVEGAQRMHGMIGDVLAYARVGRAPAEAEPVDLNATLDVVLRNLNAAIVDSGAHIDHQQLPTVYGDPARLLQLFQNLVGNALKFRGKEPPRIGVIAVVFPDRWRIAITDNGIGIAPEARHRIFRLFQRLHADSEFPGTGVGLALCKRIVESNGGRIGFESEPGKGSTFHFTWPKGPPPRRAP